jgi:hypothetical protein
MLRSAGINTRTNAVLLLLLCKPTLAAWQVLASCLLGRIQGTLLCGLHRKFLQGLLGVQHQVGGRQAESALHVVQFFESSFFCESVQVF